MADYNLGTARGTIEINYAGNAGAARATRDLSNAGNAASRTSDNMEKAGLALAGAGGAIVAGFGLAIKSAAEFEKQLSAVRAVSGASSAEMDQLRTKALQLGAETKFSAAEGAQAIEELVKAGISVTDVMNGAADATVALAAAGEIDLATAATIASNAMNQFQLAAAELPRIADLLAGAANASAIGVTDLGESLNYVGPVANAVGVNIDDVSTAIAILGNNGIKGSSAGTALRSVLTNLVPTTKKAATEFKNLGLITEDGTNLFRDAATGGIKPLSEVVDILNEKTAHLSATERNTFAKKSFGLETLSAVSILASQTGESFDAMASSIEKTAAADVAAARMDNLMGRVEELKGSFETLMIVVGTPFLQMVGNVVDVLKLMVNGVMLIPGPIRDLIGAVTLFIGTLALMGGALIVANARLTAFRAQLTLLAGSAAWTAIRSRLIGLYMMMGAGGPWVVALGIAATALTALFLSSRKGKADISDLTEAIKADAGALSEHTRQAIANRLERQGTLELADKLKLTLADVTGAVLGEAGATDRLNDAIADNRAKLEQQLATVDQRINTSDAFDSAIIAERDALTDQLHEYDKISGAIRKNVGELGMSKAAWDREARATKEAAAAAGAIPPAEDRIARALGNSAAKARESNGVLPQLAANTKAVGTAAGQSEAEIKRMNDAIKALFDTAYGADRALEAFHSKLNGLKEQVKQNGTNLRGMGDAANSNKEYVRQASEAIGDYAIELQELGTEPDVIARKVNNLRNMFIRQAEAAGFDADQVAEITSALEDIPGVVGAEVKVQTDDAKRELEDLKYVMETIRGKTVRVNVVSNYQNMGDDVVPEMASGGIVRRATYALVGEAGPEAVMPLPDLAESFLKIFVAAQAMPPVTDLGAQPRRDPVRQQRSSNTSRILSGSLSIDKQSRAWFTGVASDVYDGEDQFATTYGRMG